MNKEQFELEKDIIKWLCENGCTFMHAMSILSFAQQSSNSIPIAYIKLNIFDEVKANNQFES